MATFLQLKNIVANRSGRTDGGTANTIRDNAINNVIRDHIANAHPFSWLKRSTTVATDSSGEADLPADFNPNHKLQPGYVYISDGAAGGDIILTEVNQETFDDFNQGGNYKFCIDYNTSTDLYRIKSSEPSTTLTLIYYHIPAELSADADVCIVPDPMCVGYLASGIVWLAKERDEANHDRDTQLGIQRLNQLILNDKRATPTRLRRGSIYTADLGFNRAD